MKKYILALLLCYIGVTNAQTEGAGKYAINGLTINTKNSDFGTAFFGDDKLVYASPKKGVSLVNDVWAENNQRYLELYVGNILPMEILKKLNCLKEK